MAKENIEEQILAYSFQRNNQLIKLVFKMWILPKNS